jgi:hypothetical protein
MAFGHVLSWESVAPVAELIPDGGGAELPPLAGRADPWIYGVKNRSNVPDAGTLQILNVESCETARRRVNRKWRSMERRHSTIPMHPRIEDPLAESISQPPRRDEP